MLSTVASVVVPAQEEGQKTVSPIRMFRKKRNRAVGIVFLVVTTWIYTTGKSTYVVDDTISPRYLNSQSALESADLGLQNETAGFIKPGPPPGESYTPAELNLTSPDRSMMYNISLAGDIDRLLWDLDMNTSDKVRTKGVTTSLACLLFP